MGLILDVDGKVWRTHLEDFTGRTPGLVGVVKGNGYGFGRPLLGAEATSLGLDTLAVSDAVEVASVRETFAGDILVMSPWLVHRGEPALEDAKVVRTIGHLAAAEALVGATSGPVVVEGATSMRRHGLTTAEFEQALPVLAKIDVAGLALHLPIDRPRGTDPMRQVEHWIECYAATGAPPKTLYVSHLRPQELADLAARHPDINVRPRIGTALWLDNRRAFTARATVLDVRPLRPGDHFGYRQQRARRASILVVVGAGTAHGVGLEAPVTPRGVVRRGKVLARGALEAGGAALSPFTIGGRQRWWAEPPHMQVSIVLMPARETPPAVGDEVELDVRMTTTTFEEIRGL